MLTAKYYWALLGLLMLGICLNLLAGTTDNESSDKGEGNPNSELESMSNSGSDLDDIPDSNIPPNSASGLDKIQHFVFIMQEDRSFDSYFGTYPGADGIPKGISFIDPQNGTSVTPYHDTSDVNTGGPNSLKNAQADIDNGKMDGFLKEAYQDFTSNEQTVILSKIAGKNPQEVLGYHDYHEIPNYWNYAMLYVLQDHMFGSIDSENLQETLSYLATQGSSSSENQSSQPSTDNFLELAGVLTGGKVDWKCYVTSKQSSTLITPTNNSPTSTSHLMDTAQFYQDAQAGTLPQVSWIFPYETVSEKPPAGVREGMAYVTGLVNAIMRSPDWYSTAIFISWDDWGGFYDHVAPPQIGKDDLGIRVPGLVISPYAKQNYIDHHTYSFESWLRIIEERFNIHPSGSTGTGIADMQDAFDFNQKPRVPIILAPTKDGSIFPQPLQHPEL